MDRLAAGLARATPGRGPPGQDISTPAKKTPVEEQTPEKVEQMKARGRLCQFWSGEHAEDPDGWICERPGRFAAQTLGTGDQWWWFCEDCLPAMRAGGRVTRVEPLQ